MGGGLTSLGKISSHSKLVCVDDGSSDRPQVSVDADLQDDIDAIEAMVDNFTG
ncbi:MAG: hypothetical protein ACREQZ_04770 [Woeseiaceae bacterium]